MPRGFTQHARQHVVDAARQVFVPLLAHCCLAWAWPLILRCNYFAFSSPVRHKLQPQSNIEASNVANGFLGLLIVIGLLYYEYEPQNTTLTVRPFITSPIPEGHTRNLAPYIQEPWRPDAQNPKP